MLSQCLDRLIHFVGRWLVLFAVLLLSGQTALAQDNTLSAYERATIALFERSKDSVVYITTSQTVRDVWTRNVLTVPQGSGSGFIWDNQGHIVTNYHVIEGASKATVTLSDGQQYNATLTGASAAHDLAVLKIDAKFKRPTPVPIGSSANLHVGQHVFAIGNPFGLDWTLTTGVISALNRALPNKRSNRIIENLIQTDAAINPGNSGGPLLDSRGRLIGINTAIYSPSGASIGISFAVPVDTVSRVVPELIKNGEYTQPVLGIEIDDPLNKRLIRALGVQGVYVLGIQRGSGAARAGLRGPTRDQGGSIVPGDIITAINDEPVTSVAKLLATLDRYRPGQTVTLTIQRGKKSIKKPVKLKPGR